MKLRHLLAILLPLCAFAGTAVVTPGDWPLYKGSTIHSRYPTEAACIQKAKDLNLTATYTCRTSTAVAVTATSSSSSSSVSSSSSSSVSSSSSSSAPTWTPCANEGSRCAFTGSRTVRFGIDTRWDVRTFTDGVQCSTSYFLDPAPSVTKSCQLQDSSSSGSSSSSSSTSSSASTAPVTLTWTRPTQNTDGSALTGITGYRLYYGTSLGAPMQSVIVGDVTTSTIPGLATGQTWYFRIATMTAAETGNMSNAASKTL